MVHCFMTVFMISEYSVILNTRLIIFEEFINLYIDKSSKVNAVYSGTTPFIKSLNKSKLIKK